MTVADLQEKMSAVELDHWQAYEKLEPFGPAQEDLRAGQIASLLHWAHKGQNSESLGPDHFFPSLRKPESEEDSPDDIEAEKRAILVQLAMTGQPPAKDKSVPTISLAEAFRRDREEELQDEA